MPLRARAVNIFVTILLQKLNKKSVDKTIQMWYNDIVKREGKPMTQKNKEKEERKAKRKPPIPYTRRTPTKKEALEKFSKKFKKGIDILYGM